VGLWPDGRGDDHPAMPMLVVVAPPARYVATDGVAWDEGAMDLCARLMYLDQFHASMAGTGSICLAAAARIEGSVVEQAIGRAAALHPEVRIGHPSGVTTVRAQPEPAVNASPGMPIRFAALGFGRTARALMRGSICVPRS
jgi:2-methylaconitate cis-trans-isomerase PrpF